MVNVMDNFQHLEGMSQVQLLERQTSLVGTAPAGDYKQLSDLALQELVAISRVLRRKTSTGTRASPSRKGVAPTLDMI